MNNRAPLRLITYASLVILLALSSLSPARAQLKKREHLTPEEIEMVRDAQQIDLRTEVFVKAAERRLDALLEPQKARKDAEKWGAIPQGTRAEQFTDVARILDEAIVNIDNAASRSASSPLFAKAVRKLAEASNRFLSQLSPLRASTRGAEREAIEQVVESLQQVVAAAGKLPPETDQKEKGKKKG